MNENNSYDDTPKNISTGRLLKSARQELGLSLEEASRQTGIPASILESIEREDGIPSGAFRSRVFLRSYTDYLGLDGSVLSRHPKPERPTGETPQQVRSAEANQREKLQRETPQGNYPERKRRGRNHRNRKCSNKKRRGRHRLNLSSRRVGCTRVTGLRSMWFMLWRM